MPDDEFAGWTKPVAPPRREDRPQGLPSAPGNPKPLDEWNQGWRDASETESRHGGYTRGEFEAEQQRAESWKRRALGLEALEAENEWLRERVGSLMLEEPAKTAGLYAAIDELRRGPTTMRGIRYVCAACASSLDDAEGE